MSFFFSKRPRLIPIRIPVPFVNIGCTEAFIHQLELYLSRTLSLALYGNYEIVLDTARCTTTFKSDAQSSVYQESEVWKYLFLWLRHVDYKKRISSLLSIRHPTTHPCEQESGVPFLVLIGYALSFFDRFQLPPSFKTRYPNSRVCFVAEPGDGGDGLNWKEKKQRMDELREDLLLPLQHSFVDIPFYKYVVQKGIEAGTPLVFDGITIHENSDTFDWLLSFIIQTTEIYHLERKQILYHTTSLCADIIENVLSSYL
jgi:hypothetical protein